MFGSGKAVYQHPPSAKRRLQRRAGRTLSPPNMNSTYAKKTQWSLTSDITYSYFDYSENSGRHSATSHPSFDYLNKNIGR